MPTLYRCSRTNPRTLIDNVVIMLAIAGGVAVSVGSVKAQEPTQEPPRIFRGGIVQQLRSMTEDAFQTQRAETKKSGNRGDDNSLDREMSYPQPPSFKSRIDSGKFGSNSISSNPGSRTATRPTSNDLQRQARADASGQAALNSSLPSAARVPFRAPAAGIPVSDPTLANGARFRQNDEEATKLYSSEPAQVQAVESSANAPKVSRRPLPSGSASSAAIEAEPKVETRAPIVANKRATTSLPSAPAKSEPVLPSLPAPLESKPKFSPDTSYPALGVTDPKASKTTTSSSVVPKVSQPNGVPASLIATKKPIPTESTQPALPPLPDPTQQHLPTTSFGLPSSTVSVSDKNSTSLQTASDKAASGSNSGQLANPIRNGEADIVGDEHMSSETPRLQVLMKGPGSLAVGSPVDYQVLVRNQDSIALSGIVLRMNIPADVAYQLGKPSHGAFQSEKKADGSTLVTWTFDHLEAERTASAPVQLVAKQARNFALAMDWTLIPKSGEAQFEVRHARLELTLEGPSEVEFGIANSYRLSVRNPGNAVAQNVKVNLGAAAFGSSEAEIGDIKPGEQQSIEVELTFHERGTISIHAEADGEAKLHSDAKIDVLVQQAQLVAELTGADRVYHGTSASYQAKIQNVGNLEGRDVRASLTLPPGVEVLNKPADATLNGNQLTWTITSLKPAQSLTFPIELLLRSAGEHKFALTCESPRVPSAAAHSTTTVEAITDLKLVVNDPIAPAPVGGTVTYELSVTNRGSRAAMNVKILAQFSEGIEPLQADGAKHRVVPGQVIFDPIATIAAGETKMLKIYAKAEKPGTHRFRAEVKSDESDLRLVQEETTQYLDSNPSRLASPISNKVTR